MQRFLAPVLALVALALLGGRALADELEFALLTGWARVSTQHGVYWLTPSSPALLVHGGAYFELGPDCRLELVDTGRASFVFEGTTSAELRRLANGESELYLRRFETLGLHALRGRTNVLLPAGQRLLAGSAVVQLFGRPDGAVRIEHMLGQAVELDIGGWYTFELAVGTRRMLPPRLEALPAVRRRDDFRGLLPARTPRPPPPVEEVTRGAAFLPGARSSAGAANTVMSTLLDAGRHAQASLRKL